MATANPLGTYLKDRRARLDPVALGLPASRRRTPGLRREEVAQRANISATWYTWLEQGRGGAPSADVLNRLANGLMLTELEREHLFMLGLGRPPEVHYKAADGVTPRLQRVLDAFDASPAFIKTATWDVVAWNKAAAFVLTDYAKLEPRQRNILRLIFDNDRVRAAQEDWLSVARYVVGAFRADATRAGATAEIEDLVDELCRSSSDFETLWRDNDVSTQGDGLKRLHHPLLGAIQFEYSHFSVDGRPELGMVVYNAIQPEDADRIRAHIASHHAPR
jgi:transcriptional regulator with XRE-family HTH domain